MENIVVAPENFIEQLKNALIPELIEQLKEEFQPKEPVEYLTIGEVCKLLKITKPTLWNWRADNKISAYGIGNRVFFKRSEIDELINKNKIK